MLIKIFLFTVLLTYFYVTIKAQRKINSTIMLTKKQKTINSILIWLIPFIWYFLIKHLIKPDNNIMTKAKRKELIKKGSAGFSSTGSSGVGLHG